jgi:hypothetical protein
LVIGIVRVVLWDIACPLPPCHNVSVSIRRSIFITHAFSSRMTTTMGSFGRRGNEHG